MKTILLILAALILSACGQTSNGGGGSANAQASLCSSDAVGSWRNPENTDQMTVAGNCMAKTMYCETVATMTDPNSTGDFSMTIHSNNGKPGCWAVGLHQCVVTFTHYGVVQAKEMRIVCGSQTSYYFRN